MHALRDAIQRDTLITYACAITYQTQFGLRKRFRATGTGRSPKSATKEKDKLSLVFGAGGEICSERNERNSEPSEFTHKGERHSRRASSCRRHRAQPKIRQLLKEEIIRKK